VEPITHADTTLSHDPSIVKLAVVEQEILDRLTRQQWLIAQSE